MSEEDVVLDPEKLTIARLRSVIAEEGFPHVLPTGTARKSVYVHLYNEHVAPKLQKRAAAKLTRERQSLGGASAGKKLGLADSPSTAAKKRSARRKTVSSLRPVSSEGSEDEENTPPQLSPNKRRTLLSPPPSTRKKTSATSSAATSTATPKTEQKPKRLAKRRKSLMSPTSALRTKKKSTKAEEEEETKKEEEEEEEEFGSRVEGKKIVSPKARKKVSLSTNDSASSSSEEKQQSEEEEEASSGLEPITSPEQARRFLRRRRSAIPYARERSPSKPDNVPLLDLPAEITSSSSSASTSTSTTATMKSLHVEHRRPSSRKGHWFWQLLNGLMIVAELSLLVMIVLFLFPSLLQYFPPLPFTITIPSTTTSESSGGSGWSFSSFFQPAAVALPYCNTGDNPKLAGINPTTQEHILSCRMCPRNGMCREGAFVGCKEGFAKSADGESCVEDEEITRAAHSMKEPTREILSYRRGLYECQPNDYSSPEIAEAELKQLLKERIAASASSFSFLWGDSSALLSSDAKFEAAFDRFKKEAKANEDQWDIHQRLSLYQPQQLNFFTTRHITLPLMCELRLRLLEFKWYLLAATAVALFIPFLMWKRRQALAEAAEVDALVEEAKDLLVMQRQRALQQEEDSYKSSSWLPVTHVRDMLFHDDPVRKKRYIGSAKKEREMHRLWAQVVKAVSTDRRVSTCPQIVEGLQQTTWEWVSHIPEEHATQLLSPKRERGTRASLGRPSLQQQLNFSPRSDYDDVNEPLQQQQEHHHHEHQVGNGEELSHASSLYPRFG